MLVDVGANDTREIRHPPPLPERIGDFREGNDNKKGETNGESVHVYRLYRQDTSR
jgi:hypothetical protein